MATNFSGRSGHRWGRVGSFGARTGSWGQTTSRGKRTGGTTASVPPSYKHVNKSFQYKIESYKTLVNQTTGAAKYTRPTPAQLNTFANWVNKGNIVQTVSCAQLSKWARTHNQTFNTRNATVTSCRNVLTRKFGKSPIKACARAKNGAFMVVTSPTWQGRPFAFPK